MSKGEFYWWGTKMCCNEEETKQMCNLLDIGGTVTSLAGSLAPAGDEKIALSIAGAAVKLGTTVIKAVDTAGGSNGVCLYTLWGVGTCWVKARPQ
jgi:hypothetical protein